MLIHFFENRFMRRRRGRGRRLCRSLRGMADGGAVRQCGGTQARVCMLFLELRIELFDLRLQRGNLLAESAGAV